LNSTWQRVDSLEIIARRAAREGRVFAFTLAGGFLVWGLLALRKDRHTAAAIGFAFAAVSLLVGVLVPGRLGPARRAWMRLGEAIGALTTPVLMAALYYLVVTPMAMLRRLRRRPLPAKNSRWHQRAPLPPASRMERQF
jgi:cell division protein FtsW (lipid II flippase)